MGDIEGRILWHSGVIHLAWPWECRRVSSVTRFFHNRAQRCETMRSSNRRLQRNQTITYHCVIESKKLDENILAHFASFSRIQEKIFIGEEQRRARVSPGVRREWP
ncbi:hypothetical protein FRC18_008595 [Serendipita sp. 400]|nr:hypothetical protein FRC18_008595 [Serendipita sp. 400]